MFWLLGNKEGDFELKYVIYLLLMIIVIVVLFISLGQIDKLRDILLNFIRGFK